MDCKKCGFPLLNGQVICSRCDFENYENAKTGENNNYNEISNNYENTISNENNNYNQMNNNYNQMNNNYENEKQVKRKQNGFLIISSILSLLISIMTIALYLSLILPAIQNGGLTLNIVYPFAFSIILLVGSFVIRNYNLGKNNFYDNKIVFID